MLCFLLSTATATIGFNTGLFRLEFLISSLHSGSDPRAAKKVGLFYSRLPSSCDSLVLKPRARRSPLLAWESCYCIFSRMTPYTLGRAACVCRKWRYTMRIPVFWRRTCLKAWHVNGLTENFKILHSKHDGSWKKMWLLRPRLRTDGLYVSRNTYIRAGIAEWKISNPVHIVRFMYFQL